MKSTLLAATLLAGGLALPLGANAHPDTPRYSHGGYHVGPFGVVRYVWPGHRCGYDHYYGHGKKHHKWAHKHHRKHHYADHRYAHHDRYDRHYRYDSYRGDRHRRYDD